MALVPLKVLSALPPARPRHQAARDMLAEAERLDGIIRVMEADDSMFLSPELVRQWRAKKDEYARLRENAATVMNVPIAELDKVRLFDEAEAP